MLVICYVGGETCRLCGWSGGQQANWGGEKEEQSWSGCQTIPGSVIIISLLRNLEYILILRCVRKLPSCNECSASSPGEKPHVAVCKLPGWESHFWLADQREYDTAAEKLWVHLSSQWQVYQTGARRKRETKILVCIKFVDIHLHISVI